MRHAPCAMRHASCAVRRRHRASASRHRGPMVTGAGFSVPSSRFKVQSPNLQLSAFNLRPARSCLVSPPSTERSEGVWGESRRSREGGTVRSTSDAWWAPSDGAPSVSDPCHQCRGDDPPAPPEVGVGSTSPNVVAFGSSWRRKQEAAGTSRATTQASGIGYRASAQVPVATGTGFSVPSSKFKVQRPNLQLSTFNLQPSSFIVHR
jgi:hypothetical protein